jgi:methionyl-tRNA formyltransferase
VTRHFKIIFMGTPAFAVPSLRALFDSDHEVLLTVTRPDRPAGRGRRQRLPPVKTCALDGGCALLQPDSVREPAFAQKLSALAADLTVVVAYGQILPPELLCATPLGAVNVHASLLPRYRGPAPIHWAIINGEKQTGVSTMLMDRGMDTGDILLSASEPIRDDDTAASLHDRLARKGARLLLKTLEAMAAGSMQPQPQDHSRATYAPLLKKNDGRIDWRLSADQLDRFIRGMTPWPGAFTCCGKRRLKILKAHPIQAEPGAPAGTVIAGFPDELRIAAGKGALSILRIQSESGKPLAVEDFLRGHPMPRGTVLS